MNNSSKIQPNLNNLSNLNNYTHFSSKYSSSRSQSISIPCKNKVDQNNYYSFPSNSAPKNLQKSYIENYFNNHTNEIQTNIPVFGVSPSKNDSSNNILHKSINTLKGFLH